LFLIKLPHSLLQLLARCRIPPDKVLWIMDLHVGEFEERSEGLWQDGVGLTPSRVHSRFDHGTSKYRISRGRSRVTLNLFGGLSVELRSDFTVLPQVEFDALAATSKQR